jgi:hypothetical protein
VDFHIEHKVHTLINLKLSVKKKPCWMLISLDRTLFIAVSVGLSLSFPWKTDAKNNVRNLWTELEDGSRKPHCFSRYYSVVCRYYDINLCRKEHLKIYCYYYFWLYFQVPVTVAEQSEAWTVFARSDAGIVGSNHTQGTDVWCVCVCVYPVFVLSCV